MRLGKVGGRGARVRVLRLKRKLYRELAGKKRKRFKVAPVVGIATHDDPGEIDPAQIDCGSDPFAEQGQPVAPRSLTHCIADPARDELKNR
jgi:hypothetical protein